MAVKPSDIDRVIRDATDDAVRFLTGMMTFESVQGDERDVQALVAETFGGLGLEVASAPIPERADAVVVLEITDLAFCIANRGAVWFQLDVEGRPTHMGSITEGISAIEKANEVIAIWRGYERELIESAKTQSLFAEYERPTQLCVGMIAGGEWPSMVPARCHVEGGIGFLPDRSLAEVKGALADLIEGRGDAWLRSHYRLAFDKLHNDAFETPADDAFVASMGASVASAGLDATPKGWISSCDARLWRKVGGMPTVVFGPGTLKSAHSDNESVKIADIQTAARALVMTAIDWCGY